MNNRETKSIYYRIVNTHLILQFVYILFTFVHFFKYGIMQVKTGIILSVMLSLFVFDLKAQTLHSLVELEKQTKFTLDEAMASPSPETVYYIDNSGISQKNIPSEIIKFRNLQKIVLWKNELSNLPAEFFQLMNLQVVVLRENFLADTGILEEFAKLPNMIALDLSLNQFSTVPQTFFEQPKLRKLNLSFNLIENLPVNISKCKQLGEIQLNNNQLVALPDEIGELKNLYELDLQHNNLEVLPELFCTLSSLEILNLKENPIRNMPVSLKKLESLEELYFSRHSLSDDEIRRISSELSEVEISYDEN